MNNILLSADNFTLSRGRMSDVYGGGGGDNIIIIIGGIVILVLLCVGAMYLWQSHREKVKATGCVILGLLALYVIGCVANLIYMGVKKNRESSRAKEPTAVSVEPAGATPPTTTFQMVQSPTANDPWAAYPPVSDVKSETGKTNDFLVAATNNPSYTIYDLMCYGGMRPGNTQFLSESNYTKSQWVRQHYTPQEFHQAYRKLSSAWQAFQRCSGIDVNDPEISKYMMHYDMFDIDKPQISDADNPQLIKDLKRVPLQ